MSDLTESEIRSFQQARGLDVTGFVDAVTARALEEARWKLGDRSLYLQQLPCWQAQVLDFVVLHFDEELKELPQKQSLLDELRQ